MGLRDCNGSVEGGAREEKGEREMIVWVGVGGGVGIAPQGYNRMVQERKMEVWRKKNTEALPFNELLNLQVV